MRQTWSRGEIENGKRDALSYVAVIFYIVTSLGPGGARNGGMASARFGPRRPRPTSRFLFLCAELNRMARRFDDGPFFRESCAIQRRAVAVWAPSPDKVL